MLRLLTPEERAQRETEDRETVIREWFNGDAAAAERAMNALPYSTIPTWEDLDTVIAAVTTGLEETRNS